MGIAAAAVGGLSDLFISAGIGADIACSLDGRQSFDRCADRRSDGRRDRRLRQHGRGRTGDRRDGRRCTGGCRRWSAELGAYWRQPAHWRLGGWRRRFGLRASERQRRVGRAECARRGRGVCSFSRTGLHCARRRGQWGFNRGPWRHRRGTWHLSGFDGRRVGRLTQWPERPVKRDGEWLFTARAVWTTR